MVSNPLLIFFVIASYLPFACLPLLTTTHALGFPHSLDGFGETDIVRLELVQAYANQDGDGVEGPHGELAGFRVAVSGDVVDEYLLKAAVAMDKQQSTEDGVHAGVQGAAGKWCDGQGDQTGGDGPLEGPVIGAVDGRWFGYGCRVVHCARRQPKSFSSLNVLHLGIGLESMIIPGGGVLFVRWYSLGALKVLHT